MSVREAIQHKSRARSVPAPFIEMEAPDEYHIPTEFYVKRLINGPFEFGTVTISEEVHEPTESMRSTLSYEVDLAMHPNFGLAICGYLSTNSNEEIQGQLKMLEVQREKLLADLNQTYDLQGRMPPVGIFIAMPKARAPRDWDWGRAHICGAKEIESLEQELLRCMKETARKAEQTDYEHWPRVVAVIRSKGFHSALEWLLTFSEI